MKLEQLPPTNLHAISALLRAAYMEGVRMQHGWMGPLADVQALATRYEQIADSLEDEDREDDHERWANREITPFIR